MSSMNTTLLSMTTSSSICPEGNSTDSLPPTTMTNIIVTVFIAVFFVFGTVGNVLTVVVIVRNNCLHTISNCFIFSLCLSDMFSALICSPLWLYRRTWGFDCWQWGDFLCEFYWVSDFTTNYVTSLHIFSFAALRFYAVKRPFSMSGISKQRVLIYIGSLWILSMLVALPIAWLFGVDNRRKGSDNPWPACSINHADLYEIYISITSPIFFYLPMLCIIIFSSLIAHVLVKRCRWRNASCGMKMRYSTANAGSVCSRGVDLGNATSAGCQNGHQNGYNRDGCRGLNQIQRSATLPSQSRESSSPIFSGIELPSGPRRDVPARSRRRIFSDSDALGNSPGAIGQFRVAANYMHYSRERRIFTQLGLIVIAFMIGYVPQTVYLLWTTLQKTRNNEIDFESDYWFGTMSYICLRFSECMNPVMYNIGSSKMRQATKTLLRNLLCFKDSQNSSHSCRV